MFPDLLRDDIFRLETKRLWLRWPRMADAAAIVRLAGDKDVSQMTERLPHPYPPAVAEKWIFESRVGNAQGSAAVLALTLKHRPQDLIGTVGIHQTRPGRAVIGYWLGKPFWNQGLAREAVGELVDLAFRTSEVERIDAQVRVDNPASRAVLEDSGFRLEGVGLVDMPVRGGAFDCQRFQLDRAGWMAAQQVRDAALLAADCVRSAG